MADINFVSCWGDPIGNYDPDTCNNGGGYWQFSGGALFAADDGRRIVIEVDDLSCGDFGSRVFCTITVQNSDQTLEWPVNLGTMQDACISSELDVQAVYAAVSRELGIVPDDVAAMVSDARCGADAVAWRER